MRILSVDISRFRNVQRARLEPHSRFNVLCGGNGQGKTNFLEAVYLLGTLRSFRSPRLEDLVEFGAEGCVVRASVSSRSLERCFEVEVAGRPRQKQASVDGKAVRQASEYFGGFNVILFTPEELRLVRGSPGDRRRFLDRAVWNAEPAFLREAQTYERLLRSRNHVLRSGGDDVLLDTYDEQLARAGEIIVARRRAYTARLSERVGRIWSQLASGEGQARVAYSGRLDEEQGLLARLAAGRSRDRERGFTSAGPHADDLEILLDDRPARVHASQGQVRSIVLALKMAEVEHLREALEEAPVLLLDDVSSELDPRRTEQLMGFVERLGCQTFLTTTTPEHLPLPPERAVFQVLRGDFRG